MILNNNIKIICNTNIKTVYNINTEYVLYFTSYINNIKFDNKLIFDFNNHNTFINYLMNLNNKFT